jgi:hypothetical protein
MLRNRVTALRSWITPLIALFTLLFLSAAAFLTASAQGSIIQYFQGFEVNNVWAPTSMVNRVASGTNGITSKSGGFHGEVTTQNTQWGGYNATFPPLGYTTAVDVYLNVGGGFSNDTRFDFTSAISTPALAHRRDFAFNAGYYNDAAAPGSGPRFVVSASNSTGRPNSFPKNPGRDPFVITGTGWYTFKHKFYDSGGGVLAVDLSILDSSGNTIHTWTLSDPSDIIGSTVGGNRYGWFANNEFTFLAIDNSVRANLAADPSTVYVDDSWAGTAPGADPDGAGPATSFGYDAFDTIQGGVTAVATGGSVNVASGTYPVTATINLNKALTLAGASPQPVVQVAQATGNLFAVTAANVTLDNFEIQKTDVNGEHNLIYVQGNNFEAKNNLIHGLVPQDWSVSGIVSRAFVIAAGNTNLSIHDNTIHTLRQPMYTSGVNGTIANNTVYGTKGWVVEQGAYIFTGNNFSGTPQNVGADIALLASVNPADYPNLLALSLANDNAYISAQFGGALSGRAASYVNSSAGAGGNGSAGFNYQSITSGINGALVGGTVNVAAGGYNEDVAVTRSVIVSGAGFASTTVTGPIGGPGSTFSVQANNVELRGFTITRAGNNVAQWNDPNLNSGGVTVQGLAITGLNLHDNRVTGMRTGIDINNSNGHTIHNNVITDNHTGMIMRNQTDNLTVVENEVTNNRTVGILFIDASGGSNSPVQTALNCSFFNNNISGNWYGQIVDRQSGGSLPAPGTTNLKNFSGNWLGTNAPVVTTANSAEPAYSGHIPVTYGGTATAPGGQPDLAGPASANLDYSPYLNGGADTNVQTTPGRGTYGFQGSFAALNVSATSPQAASPAISSIQEAINLITVGGTLSVPTGTYPGNVNVNKAITLAGTFTVGGTLTISAAGAVLSPGYSPGIINSGNLSLSAGSNVNIELNGTTPGTGYDQLNVTGTVSLGNANLNVTTGFTPAIGNTFTIVNNDGADAVTGIFNELPEATVFYIASNAFRISYVGGDGNDVVLTSVSLCNTVSIPTNITSYTGANVTVPINVDDVTGHGLLSYDFTLTYNPAVVTPLGIDQTGTLSSGMTITINNPSPGTLVISGFQSQPLTGAGTLLKLTFSAIGGIGSSSSLNFTSFKFNEGTPCLSTTNGNVTIISGAISGAVTYANAPSTTPVPNTTLSATGSVNVSTTSAFITGAYSLSGLGSGPYTVTPSKSGDVNGISGFDSAMIAQHVVLLITLNATQLAAADVSGNSTVSSFDAALIARYVALLPGSGDTGNWKFIPINRMYPNAETNQTNQDYSAILMGEVSGNWVPPTSFAKGPEESLAAQKIESVQLVPVSVIAPTSLVMTGTNFTLPVTVGDTTGRGIISYEFDLSYNPSVVQPQATPVDVTGTISSGMTVTTNVPSPGILKVVIFGTTARTGAGTLLNFKFTALGPTGSMSPLTWDRFMFNEDPDLDIPTNGLLTLISPTAVGATVGGRLTTAFGQPVPNARVIMVDMSGVSRTTLSTSLGFYRFYDVQVGQTYVITVDSKTHTFTSQAVSVGQNVTDIDLIANP